MPATNFSRLARQIVTTVAIAAALGAAAQAASAAVRPGDHDVGGIAAARPADRDAFTDGARTGERNPFVDGARIGTHDVFTDGARGAGDAATIARISNRDGYTESEHAPANGDRAALHAAA
ncbi:hypothetical protein [Cupriavidus necator]|uniref:hypothetical protein n=1 Tax=Cupriavidus necator TaxID=106590 RepID=UPI0005B31C44|nr:hypothetical protein [Cupriavidus necator]